MASLPAGFNWFLIFVAVVVCILIVVMNVYIIINLQHPEDRNQAYFPKIVVLFGLSLSFITVLMFPMDVANREACDSSLLSTACTYAMPMYKLWLAVYIMNVCLVYAVIPFTLFFYEADTETPLGKKIFIAFIWTLVVAGVFFIILGIAYAFAGYTEYPSIYLTSGMATLNSTTTYNGCFEDPAYLSNSSTTARYNSTSYKLCSAFSYQIPTTTWSLRISFPLYIVALSSVIGWIFFMFYAGMGMMALPVDWIKDFIGKPSATITRSQYIERARGLAIRAQKCKEQSDTLRKEERGTGRNRKWRFNVKKLQQELNLLESDQQQLEDVYPQGENRQYLWIMYQLSFYLRLIMGIVGIFVGLLWLVHIIIYILPSSPFFPFLNFFFAALDGVFPLFGVGFFALFCFFLIAASVKGNFKIGQFPIPFINLYPIKIGGTQMSSMLFNTALILLSSSAVIQFCAVAFGSYANDTDIQSIFGAQLYGLRGFRWIYQTNIFIYVLVIMSFVGGVLTFVFGRKRQWMINREKKYEDEKL